MIHPHVGQRSECGLCNVHAITDVAFSFPVTLNTKILKEEDILDHVVVDMQLSTSCLSLPLLCFHCMVGRTIVLCVFSNRMAG